MTCFPKISGYLPCATESIPEKLGKHSPPERSNPSPAVHVKKSNKSMMNKNFSVTAEWLVCQLFQERM